MSNKTSIMDQQPNVAAVPETSDEQLLIEKRIRRRAKNKLKKEDMKRTKEEEKRRKLYEPKDQRVKVVNQNELATMCKPQETFSGSLKPKHSLPIISSDDFPTLGSSKPKFRDRLPQTTPHSQISADNTARTTDYESAVLSLETTETLTARANQVQNLLTNKDQLSKPKRKDPIKIDVLTAIKKFELPKVQHERNTHTKKESPTQRSGNQLDASNPERKKGKVREIPKAKKPSQLKRVILKERDAKRNPLEVDTSVTEIAAQLSLDEREELSPETPRDLNSPNSFANPESDIQQESDMVGEENELIKANGSSLKSSLLAMSGRRSIHTRKFREYCNHSLSPELDVLLSSLITDIVKFQDRAYFNDPIKAHAKRRFVLGFREAKKYLTLKKLKLLIFAPDLEKVKSEGGIDDLIEQLKGEATNQAVPYVFGVGRRNLKKLTNKSFKLQGISCIGILNYEGAQDDFNKIQDLLPSLRLDYEKRLESAELEFTKVDHDEISISGPDDSVQKENQETQEKEEAVASFLTKLKELHQG